MEILIELNIYRVSPKKLGIVLRAHFRGYNGLKSIKKKIRNKKIPTQNSVLLQQNSDLLDVSKFTFISPPPPPPPNHPTEGGFSIDVSITEKC